MDGASCSTSILPWVWTIEALAGAKEADLSLLHDLIEIAPVKPHEFDNNTRELLALRCLEGLSGCDGGNAGDSPTCLDPKVGIDSSQSCEDVLQCILHEIPLSNLRKCVPELLKWPVYPFTLQKRASMASCTLQQLKESIHQGNHLRGNFLMERSGLTNNDHAALVKDCNQNVLARTSSGVYSDVEKLGENVNSCPQVTEKENKLLEECLCEKNSSSLKRVKVDADNEDVYRHMHGTQDDGNEHNFHTKAKKIKFYSSPYIESQKESPVSQNGKDLEISLEKDLLSTEIEECDSEKNNMVTMENDHILEHGCDGNTLPCRGYGIDDEIHPNQPDISHDVVNQQTSDCEPYPNRNEGITGDNNELIAVALKDEDECKISVSESQSKYENDFQVQAPTAASPEASQKKIATHEVEDDLDHCCDGEMLSGDNRCQEEITDVATKKHEFLSSQCLLSQNFSETCEWSFQNLCMKCNEGGQLLGCNTATCPLVVHDNCLGTSPRFDENGNFYCPFCAYSSAISAYLGAKKKVSMARRDLATFIQKGIGHHCSEHVNIFHKKDHDLSKKHDHDHIKYYRSVQSADKERFQEDHCPNHVNEVSTLNAGDGNLQLQPSALREKASLSCREEEITPNEPPNALAGEKVKEKVIMEGSPARRQEEENQMPDNYENEGDRMTSSNENVIPVNKSNVEGCEGEKLEQHATNHLEEHVCVFDNEAEENSEDEIQSLCAAKPMSRRKKVPWTEEEEKILEEGVQKFAADNERGIPWRKILEFGFGVFLNGRRAMDLKDKWRNMSRARSKSK